MAKVNGPLFSLTARGALSQAIVYQRRFSGHIVRRYNVRKQRKTLWQKVFGNFGKTQKIFYKTFKRSD